MAVDLYNCGCMWEEQPSQTGGTVKGYVLIAECAKHTQERIDNAAKAEIDRQKQAARIFLQESDWKILRHLGQKALGIPTKLTESEYLALEQERQKKRELV